MSVDGFAFVWLAVGAISLFGVVLALTDWFSNKS